jgi:hypothetical protein
MERSLIRSGVIVNEDSAHLVDARANVEYLESS